MSKLKQHLTDVLCQIAEREVEPDKRLLRFCQQVDIQARISELKRYQKRHTDVGSSDYMVIDLRLDELRKQNDRV